MNVQDVVGLLRDFLRAKALTESEIRREVGVSVNRLCAATPNDMRTAVLAFASRGKG